VSGDAWLTLGVLAVFIGLLVSNRVAPAPGIFAANIVLLLLGVTDFDQAFSGFSASAPITVAAFYVIAFAIEKTGALLPYLPYLLDRGERPRVSMARLTIPSGLASGFISNTPIVAMLIQPVRGWSERVGFPASKVLIPLSYATILGGTLTLIGTSTNLLVADLLKEATGDEIGFFEPATVALPVALIGIVMILLLGPILLPDRTAAESLSSDEMRGYVVTMVVDDDGTLEGKSLVQASLDHLTIAWIRRDGEQIDSGFDDHFELAGGDVLAILAGADQIVELQQTRGLTNTTADAVNSVSSTRATFYEAVLASESASIGRTVDEVNFPDRYGAAVVAIHRPNERVRRRVGSTKLRRGDTLLFVAERGFRQTWGPHRDFLVVNRFGGPPPTSTKYGPWALLVLAAVVVLAAFGVYDIATAALGGALVLVAAKIVTFNEARDAVNWGVVLMIASAFGIGAAVATSGLADEIADLIVNSFGSIGDFALVFGILLATMILTELISNSAAAVLMVPIALASVAGTTIDPTVMGLGVGVAASCSFVTPIGYQTNTMVFGPGGYEFADYSRLGTPMAIMALVTISTMVVLIS
jgi:di/tricarboxylate transporter